MSDEHRSKPGSLRVRALAVVSLLVAIGCAAWLLTSVGAPATTANGERTEQVAAAPRDERARPAPRHAVDATPASQPTIRRVSGRVLDERTQEPLAGAAVELRVRDHGHVDTTLATAICNPTGEFSMTTLATEGQIVAWAAGYVPESIAFDHTSDSEDSRVDLSLARGAESTLRVLRESDGSPVAGAGVWYWRTETGDPVFLGTTDAGGSVASRHALAFADVEREPLLLATTGDEAGILEPALRSDEAISRLEIRTTPTARLAVTVRGPDGSPRAGATVDVCDRDWQRRLMRVETPLGTGPDGRVTFTGLPAAASGSEYSADASSDGCTTTDVDARVAPGTTTSVEITLRPRIRGHVVATVRSASDGRGIRSSFRAGNERAESDEGTFRVPFAVYPGARLLLVAEADGHLRESPELVITRDGDQPVDFALLAREPIGGRVIDERGEPLPWVNLELAPASGQETLQHARTREDGTFVFEDATAGRWRLTLHRSMQAWYRPAAPPREFIAGARDIEVVVQRRSAGPTRLIADLRAHSQTVIDGLDRLGLRCTTDPGQRETSLGVEGNRITATGLAPGVWRLTFEAPDVGERVHVFEVPPGETEVRVSIDIGTAGTLSGELVLDDIPLGELPPRVVLTVTPMTGTLAEIDGIAPGSQARGQITIRPRLTRRFRLTNVLPDQRIVISVQAAYSGGIFGAAAATVPAGGEAQVRLRVQAGGELHVRSCEALPSGRIWLECEANDAQPWISWSHDGGGLDLTAEAAPGTWRWRARLVPHGSDAAIVEREITATVRAGATTEVSWPEK